MSQPLGYRRDWKSYLINPNFQLKVVVFSLLTSFLVIGIFYSNILYMFWRFKQQGVDRGLPANDIYFQFIGEQVSTMNTIFFVTTLITLAVILVAGLVLSHRVAGPIYRVVRHLHALRTGTPKFPLRFRDGDFFPELANELNTYLGFSGTSPLRVARPEKPDDSKASAGRQKRPRPKRR